jgi:NTP pyrophosphatase (non-canonical NTP hydrolase)
MHQKFSLVVSGSFRKFYAQIIKKIQEFEREGFIVLSPKVSKIVNPSEEFVLLESDNTTDIKALELEHLRAILNANALFLFNPDGYLGNSAIMETGYAIASKKPVFCLKEPNENVLRKFVTVASTKKMREILSGDGSASTQLFSDATISELQSYMKAMVLRRGFEKETPRDTLLLAVEEVGELAKALRKHHGIKIDHKSAENYPEISDEIADVFIYLLVLSNQLEIDLFQAFKTKEEKNNQRTWATK